MLYRASAALGLRAAWWVYSPQRLFPESNLPDNGDNTPTLFTPQQIPAISLYVSHSGNGGYVSNQQLTLGVRQLYILPYKW